MPSGIEVNNVVAAPSEMIEEVMGFPIGHGDLPSPGTPGKTQPSHKSRHKTRRAYVTLDTEKHHTETSSSEDEDNVNAPPAGATDDGTAPSEGSRSSDSEDEDHHLFQSIQYTFHTSWSHLYHGSPIQLDVPCLAVQRFLGQGEARHSTWIFDSASAMHVTGDEMSELLFLSCTLFSSSSSELCFCGLVLLVAEGNTGLRPRECCRLSVVALGRSQISRCD